MKSRLLNFIDKYHLGGSVDSVVLKVESNAISTRFITDDRLVMGDASMQSFELGDVTLPIYETSKLLKMMKVLGDDITIDIESKADTAVAMKMKDSDTRVNYVLSREDVIAPTPELKRLPNFEVSIVLSDKFIDKFIKASDSLTDVSDFTILHKDGACHIVFGYTPDRNTNKISFECETSTDTVIEPISFNSKYFREILVANRGMKDASFKISSEGLAHANFKSDVFETNYYLVKVSL